MINYSQFRSVTWAILSPALCDVGWVCSHLGAQMGQEVQNGWVKWLEVSAACQPVLSTHVIRASISPSPWLLYVAWTSIPFHSSCFPRARVPRMSTPEERKHKFPLLGIVFQHLLVVKGITKSAQVKGGNSALPLDVRSILCTQGEDKLLSTVFEDHYLRGPWKSLLLTCGSCKIMRETKECFFIL